MAFWDFLGGLASGIGDVTTSLINRQSVLDTNQQNLGLQQTQWQREDQAVQRRVADLKAAGLNPVLAASGAGAPTSLETRMEAPQLPNGIISRAISAGLAQQQIARTKMDFQVAEMQKRNAEVQLKHDSNVLNDALVIEADKQARIADAVRRMEEAKKAGWESDSARIANETAAHDWEILSKTKFMSNISGYPAAGIGGFMTGASYLRWLADQALAGMKGKFGKPAVDQLGRGALPPK